MVDQRAANWNGRWPALAWLLVVPVVSSGRESQPTLTGLK